MPYLGLMFSTYDTLHMYVPTGSDGKHSTVASLAMGGASGLFAQTITFPIDTVRNRMQVRRGSGGLWQLLTCRAGALAYGVGETEL